MAATAVLMHFGSSPHGSHGLPCLLVLGHPPSFALGQRSVDGGKSDGWQRSGHKTGEEAGSGQHDECAQIAGDNAAQDDVGELPRGGLELQRRKIRRRLG
jgi:hypothetical protein